MNKNTKKTFMILGIWLFSLILIMLNFFTPAFLDKGSMFYKNTTSILGYLFFSVQYTYNNASHFFIKFNQFKVFLLNPTINWSASAKFHTNDEPYFTLDSLIGVIYHEFDDMNIIQKQNDKLQFQLDDQLVSITVFEDENDEGFYIETIFLQKISYRESIKEFNCDFVKIIEILHNKFVINENVYTLKVKFKKYNPFCRILVKHVDDQEINFNMTYEDDNIKYYVYNNHIQAISNDFEKIKKFSSKYIALSVS